MKGLGNLSYFLDDMKVVLLENVKKVGKAGEVVNVSDGYGRNFLLAKGLGQIATAEILKNVEKLKTEKALTEKEEINKLAELAREIKDKKIVIVAKAAKGKLFGSIDKVMLGKEIKNQLGFDIGAEKIKLATPIKEVGEQKLEIELAKNIKTSINVEIKAE
ncbi:MAG: 50S ribosomal protein L9 [Candidatus Moraniibacteriota bacterium]